MWPAFVWFCSDSAPILLHSAVMLERAYYAEYSAGIIRICLPATELPYDEQVQMNAVDGGSKEVVGVLTRCPTASKPQRSVSVSMVMLSFSRSVTDRPLPEMLAFFFAFLKDLALEFAFSHFSGICTKNRIFRQLSQLPILFLCGSTCFGWHSYL